MSSTGEVMDPFIAQGQVAGAVTYVTKDGEVVCSHASGYANIASGREMRVDDLFWVASVTKPMTAAAVLMLMEEGKLALDDLLEDHLPEFANLWLIASGNDQERRLVRPRQRPTLRHLLTHTHGMQDAPKADSGVPLSAWVKACALLPLLREPGAAWEYGSIGMNALGRVVEVVSGMSFDQFLDTRFFQPLGMKDTSFYPQEDQLKRLATPYQLDESSGQLRPHDIDFLTAAPGDRQGMVMPAGGLFSTAADLSRFYQMLLNKGELEGQRYLQAVTVTDMTRNQTGDLKTGFRGGADQVAWGLGIWRVMAQLDVCEKLSIGSFGHDGAYGNSLLCDPENGLIMILMIQRKGLNPMQDAVSFRHEFQKSVLSEFTS